MALRDRIGYRLALRIYLVGLLQLAVVAVGFVAIMEANRPTDPHRRPRDHWLDGQARFVAGHVAQLLRDPAALERELASVRDTLGATVTVLDPAGAVIATNASAGAVRCADMRSEGRAPGGPPGPPCARVPVPFPDGRSGALELVLAPPPPPPPPPPWGTVVLPFVLLVVGIASVLLARSLTRPLRKMTSAARAFGDGNFGARVGITRRDELGEVARAFDEMAERVAELVRTQKELLVNVSHELRTPLARIRVALDLAAEGDAAVARESLADIAGDLHELEQLIDDVLTAARLDVGDESRSAGVLPLKCERVDVRDLLDQTASRFRAAHPERSLETDIADELPMVEGDPVLLRRVVSNLLENADRYTPRQEAAIELVARVDGDVTIEVVDQGIGIAAADLPRVFTPFFRTDRSRTRETGGLGLGLALVKRIVEAHGGMVELESVPNEGTRARVRLPAATQQRA